MKNEPIISVKNLNYTINNNQILSNISFDIYEGDFVGIIGPNGAGKSTLVKIITGEIEEYSGEVRIVRKIGYVPQTEEIEVTFPMKVYELVLLGLYKDVGPMRRFKREHYQKVKDVLELLNIEELYDRQIGELSGGEYRRVMIARALVSKPDVLILDEPEANIDKQGQEVLLNILKKLKDEKNITIILVSHDLNMIFKETTRILCLNKTIHCHKNTWDINIKDLKNLYSEDFELFAHLNGTMKAVIDRDD
ncbi:MAG: ABC transporter ATP-binding protein [Defluviitoga tunisiensis]|jgi:zinc transport system ATP-binding protein